MHFFCNSVFILKRKKCKENSMCSCCHGFYVDMTTLYATLMYATLITASTKPLINWTRWKSYYINISYDFSSFPQTILMKLNSLELYFSHYSFFWRIGLFLQEKLNVNNMGHQVIIFDFSVIRGLWETRVKKSKERQRKEKERLEQSALEK